MRKVVRFLWKVVKWLLLSIILLLILVAIVVKVPAVHDFILVKATTYFNDQTGGHLSIEEIDLRIPTYIQLNGISLKTPENENLARIGNVEISIGWRYLFDKTIRIDKFVLEDVDAQVLNRDGTGWNYDFIVNGFSDSTAVDTSTTASSWDFSLGYARLDDVGITYFDASTNDSISANLSDFSVAMNRVSVINNAYLVEKIALSNSDAFVRIGVREETTTDVAASAEDETDESSEMALDIHEVLLENNTIHYEMGAAPDKYFFDIGHLSLIIDKLDINEQVYRVEKIDFSNSAIEMAMAPAPPDTSNKPLDPFAPLDLKLDELNIDKVAFKMETYGEPEAILSLNKIHVELADLLATKDEYSGELKSLRGVYNQLDDLRDVHTGFAFTRKQIALTSLFVQYGASEINANIKVDYSGLTDLIESGKFETAYLKISDTRLEPADLKNIGKGLGVADSVMILPDNTIFIEALADGNLTNLNLDKFDVEIGNTTFKINADADGADWESKAYRINDLKLHLERSDIMNYIVAFKLDTAMIPTVLDLNMEGVFETTETQLTAEILSTYGNIDIVGNGGGYKSTEMPIHAEINSRKLNVGEFLGLDVPFITDFKLTANAENALDSSIYANASILIDTVAYDKYTLRNIDLNATLDSNLFSYQMLINDTFLVLNLGGSGALSPDFKANIAGDLQGIDLQGLGITSDDLRGQFTIKAEYGQTDKFQKGNASITNAIFVRDEERFELEPIIAEAFLSEDSSMTKVESQFFDLYSVTNRSIADLSLAIADLLGRGESTLQDTAAYWRVNFESFDTPLLRDLFVPDLESFDPATATIDFDASKPAINADINFPKIKYQNYSVDSLRLTAVGDKSNISTNLTIQHVGMDTLSLDRVHVETSTTDEGAEITFLINESEEDSIGADYYARLDLVADSVSLNKGFSINITDSLVLNKKRWRVDQENDIHSSKDGIKLSKLRIYRNQSELEINKLPEENSTQVTASDFSLAAISGMINTTEDLLTGRLFGDFTLNSDGTFAGNGKIEEFTVAQADFGLFKWDADKANDSFNVKLSSSGDALDFNATGSLTPSTESESTMDLQFNLTRFDLAALPKIVPSMIYAGDGTLSGKIDIDGSTSAPQLSGSLGFNKGKIGLVANGSTYSIDNQKIDIQADKISFNKFSIADSAGQQLVIDGNISHENFDKMRSDLTIKADNFEIANLKAEANQGYYGKLLADLDIAISGRLDAPKITANIDIDDKTALTYVVPDSEYSDSYDENMLIWTEFDTTEESDILTRSKKKEVIKRDVYANTIDLNGKIDIDENAIFRVLIDSLAGDYLQIQGGGKLGITYDRTGNLNLNGTYKVQDGFYQMSFYNIVKKKFDFQGGSQLTWNGDPMNANLDITALYKTRANVAALMSTQAGGSSNPAFAQKLPFEVVMNITGELLKPELKFDIRLAKESKGALGGAVDARLNEIASNESELNKQVFALLVLNTFISTGGSGGDQNLVENQVRNSASQILTQQLNALSDKLINGVDLNFDLQSYDGGSGQSSTDLNIDLAKSFLNNRLIIRVGSTIALEDNNQNAQNSQEMMTNISLEYKITPEGTYRFKAFRTTDLEDIVVGRITRTGAGVLYQKDFNRIENLFKVKSDLGNEGKSVDEETDDDPDPNDGK